MGVQVLPREGALLGECLAIAKHTILGLWLSCAKMGRMILTYMLYDVLLHKELLYGGCNVTAPHIGGRIPQKLPFGT